MKKSTYIILIFIFFVRFSLTAQEQTNIQECSAALENDLLTLQNSCISRVYRWNNGQLITHTLTDKSTGKIWQSTSGHPDLYLPWEHSPAKNATFSSVYQTETNVMPAHLRVEVAFMTGKLEVKRIFRIYPGCPAIACDLYYRGRSSGTWTMDNKSAADLVNIENLNAAATSNTPPAIEQLSLSGRHWQLRAIEFFDITDRFNNLVREVNVFSYRPMSYRGNILIAHDQTTDAGVFFLKESPVSNVQLAYPGGDFFTDFGSFKVIGAGIEPSDLDEKEWIRGYGFVTGVYSGGSQNSLPALRNYQKNVRILKPERDEMILMNTWGDRGQDTRINEAFALKELEAGKQLGITHFQLDDGWQTGRTSNSAYKNGSLDTIWNNPKFWHPDPVKFPRGLKSVVEHGKKCGIEVCLWFNPSKDNENAGWEKDADVLTGFYRKDGIRTFKIDGVNLPSKTAEMNFRKFLDKVSLNTGHNVVFNLDVTAHRRGGYHYFNEYGNLFLENRYTDWVNYYPYTTLRNLWMLSGYVPAEKIQIEFLNKWRNTDKYGNDPFAPANYSFEYLFAITMAGQPLAWFEGTGLPSEAFDALAPVLKKYREIQHDLHSGDIFPIGNEPSGKSWTGFQSVQKTHGYFLVFREANKESSARFNTWLQPGTRVQCVPVLGQGSAFTAVAGAEGEITFHLSTPNSYALYSYSIDK